MSAEHEIDEESIFIAAMELPAAEQAEFLAETCGDDVSLRQRIELLLQANNSDNSWLDEPACSADALLESPKQIGRYQIRGTLGEGGFGTVYSAFDDQLDRPVAIKVPHAQFLRNSEITAAQLAEARTVAGLDHPNIVPVFDVGTDAELSFYIVTKLVEGSDLKARIRNAPLMMDQAIELVAIIAKALHYAHTRGVIHRDVKPGNILLDKLGQPFLVDFGLALQETDVRTSSQYSGSPAYMSPEQAQGEGHRVDRRSDIFSLCVVLYELLTGQRPFLGESQSELLKCIVRCKPLAIREHNRNIPRELERICSKGLSLRACDRYFTAQELADDLQHVLADAPSDALALRTDSTSSLTSNGTSSGSSSTAAQRQSLTIVPKGLRSFDKHDADFFLRLLPGPRDYEGLPDSIRSWKARIESQDADETFSVGILYGPAGCGKSSLVKAGLIPQLASRISPIYMEASSSGTEAGLLNRLRKRFPDLSDDAGLKEALTTLRHGRGMPDDGKVLIIIDQFEQWLHARSEIQSEKLVTALRQCDGERLMCLVLVRDEFWLTLSRFMMELEIDIVPSRNAALVDLFDLYHGRRVLAAYGRAFGRLPEDGSKPSPEQQELLGKAVEGLADGERVTPVRLALFAEMMKGRSWTTETLDEVGGTHGLGVTLLEEAFSAPTADPRNRRHQEAIRGVLHVLLPDAGADIKGEMKSYDELLKVSGYQHRPEDFAELVRILDTEFRLITSINRDDHEQVELDQRLIDSATDEEQSESAVGNPKSTEPVSSDCHYQLAHDYLVHSVRDWLTRKQRETHRGRAELLLTERASYWSEMRDRRFFPGWLDWAKISCLTRRRDWTPTERSMMRAAGRQHFASLSALLSLVAIIAFGAFILTRDKYAETERATRAETDLQQSLYFAEMTLAAQESSLPTAVRNYLSRWTPQQPGDDLRGWEWYYLDSQIHRDRLAIDQLAGRVRQIDWNHDGTRIAAVVEGVGVVIWDAETGEELRTLEATNIRDLDWSPDDRWLAGGQNDGVVTIWNASSGEMSRQFSNDLTDSTIRVRWHPDSERLATVRFGVGKIEIWNHGTGQLDRSIKAHSHGIMNIAWSPDGESLASSGRDNLLNVWNASTGEKIFGVQSQGNTTKFGFVWTVCWSPDGSKIVSGGNDGVIRVLDFKEKKEVSTLESSGGIVLSVAWHPHSNKLVSGHDDHLIRVWDLSNSSLSREYRGNESSVRSVAWSPDGTRIGSGGFDKSVRIWDLENEDQNQFLYCHDTIQAMDWNSDGSRLASGGNKNNAFVWDTKTGDRVDIPVRIQGNPLIPLRVIQWSPDDRRLSLSKIQSHSFDAATDRAIQIWDTTTQEVRDLEGTTQWVGALSWSHDGTRLASGGTKGSIEIWEMNEHQKLESHSAHQGGVRCVQWNPSGTLLASCSNDGSIKVWTPSPMKLIWEYHRDRGQGTWLSWSPDGQWLATVSFDGIIRVHDGRTGIETHSFGEPNEALCCVDWSPDSKQLVTVSNDRIVRVWTIASGKMAISLVSQIWQGTPVVCWHPNGKKIAVCGTYDQNGGVIRIWDASIGYRREAEAASTDGL